MTSSTPIPIAIIGMSCRFPGGADDPQKLWDMVSEGRSSWTDVPEDRWRWKSFYHPHPEASGTHNARGGCFLNSNISEFDAGFFGIPPQEATSMDPQHRVQLESAFEALENAGIAAESIRGTDTAVYVAVASRDYDRMAYKDTSDIPKYHLTGCGDPTLCGRISYLFDLKGPSVTLDTGCSGSLVCLHQACTSLRTGESNMALVGGTHLLLGPDLTIAMSLLHMINDDGRCYSFDSRGAGYGRAEGVATVVLKRLDDAIAAGDPIRAVIRNTGVNSDGKTNGILLPSSSAQQRLMESLYRSAGINPLDVGYIEAHGTGTMAGDAAETKSISNVFNQGGKRESPLFVGSIKPNIGHLEACSGLAGLIKTVLMLEKGVIVPVPNIEEMKDGLSLNTHIKIPREVESWPAGTGRRLAAINSFGFGGTNSHAILEAAPQSSITTSTLTNGINVNVNGSNGNGHQGTNGPHNVNGDVNGLNGHKVSNGTVHDVAPNGCTGEPTSSSQVYKIYSVSAKSEKSLRANIENLLAWASNDGGKQSLDDLAYTLAARRSKMQWRWTTVSASRQDLISSLSTKSLRPIRAASDVRAVFLFTGQGAQWFAMGRELMLHQSRFRESMIKSDRVLRELGASWSVLIELMRDESDSQINKSEYSQPASTAVQIALVDLLHSLSVVPEAVVGHSSGEVAAAYTAGFLTHEMALRVSYHRSFISAWCKEDVHGKGAMIAVGLGDQEVAPFLDKLQKGSAVVACSNSPTSATVSGDESAIQELQKVLESEGIFNRKLQVDTAYHSHHMSIVAGRYLRGLQGPDAKTSALTSSAPTASVKFFSSVTGKEKTTDFGASYWVQNLVSKVRFCDALEELTHGIGAKAIGTPPRVFIEIGPHSALAGPVRQTMNELELGSFKHTYIPTLIRGRDARSTVLEMAGNAFCQGYPVDIVAANSLDGVQHGNVVVDLAPYSWDHSFKYWNESRLSKEYRMRNHPPHELLGLKIVGTSYLEPTWRNNFTVDNLPWLQEHIIDNFALFPGGAYLCMAMEAMRQIMIDRQTVGLVRKFLMKDIVYSKALVVPNSPGKVEVQLSLRPSKTMTEKNATVWEDFRVTSLSSEGLWSEHCRGSIMAEVETNVDEVEACREDELAGLAGQELVGSMRETCSESVDSQTFYDSLRDNGIDYGPNFSILTDLKVGHCRSLGTIVIPEIAASMPSNFQQEHVIHPAVLDAVMHIVLPLYSRHCSKGPVMLISIDEVVISTDILNDPGDHLLVACEMSPAGARSGIVTWSVFQDGSGSEMTPVVKLTQGEFRGIGEGHTSQTGMELDHTLGLCLDWGIDVDYLASRSLAAIKPLPIVLDGVSEGDSNKCYVDMAKYVKQLAFKNPRMKILELSAGASGATEHLLHTLTQETVADYEGFLFESYELTDTSADSLENVQDLLKEWHNVLAYKTLDISQDPIAQGFDEGSYNLIVAANYFQSISHDRLTNVRKILKTGGRLILVEGSTFSIPLTKWDKFLRTNFFNGVEITGKDYSASQARKTIVSKAISYVNEALLPSVTILSDSSDQFAKALLAYLEQNGAEASIEPVSSCRQLRNRLYLVLDYVESPLLASSPSSQEQHITSLLKSCDAVFWLTIQESPVAVNPERRLVSGIARVHRKGRKQMNFITLDIQQSISEGVPKILETVYRIASQHFSAPDGNVSGETDYVYRDENVLVPRLVPHTRFENWVGNSSGEKKVIEDKFHMSHRPIRLKVDTPGLLDSLVFVDDEDANRPLRANEVEVQCLAFGVNQKDVSIALGRAKPLAKMIGEFSGVVTAVSTEASLEFNIGDRVCGLGANPYASRARLDANLVQRLPESVSIAGGASVPYSFGTAYLALVEVARLQPLQTVLIHSAAGGIGQAAIAIAKYTGAEIFVTVGSPAKRQLLMERFNIPDSHIFSSQARTFRDGISRLTSGKGVDVVLNSLSGDSLTDTWACIANFGTFVEIGKLGKSQISTDPFDRNVTFASVDLNLYVEHQPEKVHKVLANVMPLLEVSKLQPIHPITCSPLSDIVGAFRTIQGRKHTGKLVLTTDDSTIVRMSPPKQQVLKLDDLASYLICGGSKDMIQAIARFLAAKGARTAIALVPQLLDISEKIKTEVEIDVHQIVVDLSKVDQLQTALKNCANDLPPIRGIIHIGIPVESSKTNPKRQVHEQSSRVDALAELSTHCPVDYFVSISDVSTYLGISGVVHDTAHTFDQITKLDINYTSLVLGVIETIDTDDPRTQHLLQHGCAPIKLEVFFKLLEYSFSNHSRHNDRQVIMGFDRRSMLEQDLVDLQTPLFRSLPYPKERQSDQGSSDGQVSFEQSIRAAKSSDEVHALVSIAIRQKISALVALDYEETGLDTPLEDFGLDSLVAIEFKNWIGRTLLASMQTSEILDAPSIITLAKLVMDRSTLVGDLTPEKQDDLSKKEAKTSNPSQNPLFKAISPPKLPALPLPDLNTTLKLWLDSVRVFCKPNDLERISNEIEDFQKPGGIGRELHDRLIQRADFGKENWLSDFYNATIWLNKRQPLIPFSSFFFSHRLSEFQHCQAERAAIITRASVEYMRKYEAGKLPPVYLNEQPLCTESYKWLFNTSRKPCIGSDQMQKFPSNYYIVVLRRGRVFKVMVDGISYEQLRNTFQAILDHVQNDMSWIGILTADERNSWAEHRNIIMDHSKANSDYINFIEAAAFIICLDDDSPSNAVERARRFHFGNGGNRWNDKSIQFVICANGVSGIIGDHTMIDASTANGLNDSVMDAIIAHKGGSKAVANTNILLEELPVTITPAIADHMIHVQKQFQANISKYEHAFISDSLIGGAFMRGHKCAPRSAFQMIVQLAFRRYFGVNPPCWETVTLGTFSHGRVDIVQDVVEPVARFCTAAEDINIPRADCRKLLFEAVRAHASVVTRAFRGQSYARHLLALRDVRRKDEPLPALLADPILEQTRPSIAFSNCFETTTLEKGCVLADPAGIWVHYEVEDDLVRYSITSGVGNTKKFCSILEEATKTVVTLLEEA